MNPCRKMVFAMFLLIASLVGRAQLRLEPQIYFELLPSELRLDSLQTFSSMFFPDGPLIKEQSLYLTDRDFVEVAEELGVEVAAIKAVIDIETGRTHEGFWKPGKPLINFDLSIYRQRTARHGVDINAARKRAPAIFAPVRGAGRQEAMYKRLEAAKSIDESSALESAFWGMFQIGGFNWRQCGTSSVQEFVERMSRSERDQLELFAAFCRSNDLVRFIRDKNWAAFALRYNGPSYKSRRYDKKMAAAYAKHKRQGY